MILTEEGEMAYDAQDTERFRLVGAAGGVRFK